MVEGGGVVHTQFWPTTSSTSSSSSWRRSSSVLERLALVSDAPLPLERRPARDARRGAAVRRRRCCWLDALLDPVPRRSSATRARLRRTGPARLIAQVLGGLDRVLGITLARPTLAVRRRHARRGLVHDDEPVRTAGDARRGRAPARRCRWSGRAAHWDGDRDGGALRRRGRRVPDPRPQRLRRPHARRVVSRSAPRATCSSPARDRPAAWMPAAAARRCAGSSRRRRASC